MTGLKWTRKTAQKLTNELKALGIKQVNRTSVGRLLKDLGYSLKVNHKKKALGAKKTPEARAQRNQQFEYINAVRRQFVEEGNPAISADSKKREMVGDFKNNGSSWRQKAFEVSDHDFRQYAEGIAINFGVYDMQANTGFMSVGIHHDTPAFAVDCIVRWWKQVGLKRYPGRKKLLILVDAGGSPENHGISWSMIRMTSSSDTWSPTGSIGPRACGSGACCPCSVSASCSERWWCSCSSRCVSPWPRPTTPASFIATSSPPTSCLTGAVANRIDSSSRAPRRPCRPTLGTRPPQR